MALAFQIPVLSSDAPSPAPAAGSSPRRHGTAPALPAAASSGLPESSPPPAAAAKPKCVQITLPPPAPRRNMLRDRSREGDTGPGQNTKPLQTPSYSQVIPKGSAKCHQQTAFSRRKLQRAGHRSRVSWTKGRKTTVLPSLFHGGRLISSVQSLKSHSSRAKQTAEVIALPTEPQILVHAELLDVRPGCDVGTERTTQASSPSSGWLGMHGEKSQGYL